MIRVWPTNPNEYKFVLVLVCCFCFVLFFCSRPSCCFHCQISAIFLIFALTRKPFLYFSKDIANFRFLLHNCLFSCWLENSSFLASSILLTWLSISESFKKLIFHAERSRGCIWYTTPRRCAYLPIFRFLVEKLKWTTSQLKKDLKLKTQLKNIKHKSISSFFLSKAVWRYFINF